MAGYTRVDTINNIADGNVINAADLDGEFDGIQTAFNSSTGHNHDGTSGEGAPILALGPVQDVTISTSVLGVKTTNTVDLGTSSLKFKDFYLAGAASIGGTLGVTGATTLSAALTYGGVTLSNAVTGTGNMVLSASPTLTGTITAAAANFSGAVALNGNTTIGDADTDTITQTASYVTGTQLKSAKTATNTLSLAAYDTDGSAYTNLITLTASTTPTLALTSTGVGTINNMSIGATTATTGAFTSITASTTLAVTGVATFSAGTAALPAITTTGDTNTGIFFPAADTIAFAEGGAEAMRIDSSGNVLVGTTSNASTQGATIQAITAMAARRNIATAGGPAFRMEKSRATTDGTYTIVADTDTLGDYQFFGADGVKYVIGASVKAVVNGTPGVDDMPTALTFSTTADGAAAVTERMRIDSSGFIQTLAGTSTLFGVGVPASNTTGGDLTVRAGNSLNTGTGGTLYLATGRAGGSSTVNGAIVFGLGYPTWLTGVVTEYGRFDTSGNLGIGTSSPAGLLDVDKSQNSTTSIRVGNTNAGSSANSRLIAVADAGNIQVKAMSSTNTTYGGIADAGVINCDNMSGGLLFAHNDTVGMTFSAAGNVGIGVTPSAWLSTVKAIQLSNRASIYTDSSGNTIIGNNSFVNSSSQDIYLQTAQASAYLQGTGQHKWYNAASGTAGNAITFTQAMTLDATGRLGIGVTSPTRTLDIAAATGTANAFLSSTTGTNAVYYAAGNTGGNFHIGRENSAGTTFGSSAYASVLWSEGAYPLVFATNNNERARIDAVGNLQMSDGAVMKYAPAPASLNAAATLTNANIQTQIISTTGTTFTLTMPLGTTLETLATWGNTDISYDFYVVNTASGTVTMAVNTGVTSLGTLTIATGVSAQFRIRRTAANTFVLYRLG